MTFSDVLCKYLDLIKCSGKELSKKSKISESTISAYKKGIKVPKFKSDNLNNLIEALIHIANEKNVQVSTNKIKEDLLTYSVKDIDSEIFRERLDEVILSLNINVASLAKYIGFDSSYISKIRKGERKPLKLDDFANAVCKYIIKNYKNFDKILMIDDNSHDKLYKFLTTGKNLEEDKINIFFEKIDNFDLNDYINIIKFDEVILSNIPKTFSKIKTYYGFDGYKQAQIDCLKQIALGSLEDSIFWFNNLPLAKTAEDIKFTKSYMMYLAFILKRGNTLNIIHNLNRSFDEIIAGLISWIPLYMTGQIKSFYIRNNISDLYNHIECTSQSSILHGECLVNNFDTCKLFVSNKKSDIKFYSNYSKELLKRAKPLVDVYNEHNKIRFLDYRKKSFNAKGNRKNFLIHLPVYTISDSLLDEMLDENKAAENVRVFLKKALSEEKKYMENALKNGKVYDEIYSLKDVNFAKEKPILELSRLFCKEKIYYSENTYRKHLNLIEQFKNNNENYDFKLIRKSMFKNIDIEIISDKEIIITKVNDPVTHFVINHPTLVSAIVNYSGKFD